MNVCSRYVCVRVLHVFFWCFFFCVCVCVCVGLLIQNVDMCCVRVSGSMHVDVRMMSAAFVCSSRVLDRFCGGVSAHTSTNTHPHTNIGQMEKAYGQPRRHDRHMFERDPGGVKGDMLLPQQEQQNPCHRGCASYNITGDEHMVRTTPSAGMRSVDMVGQQQSGQTHGDMQQQQQQQVLQNQVAQWKKSQSRAEVIFLLRALSSVMSASAQPLPSAVAASNVESASSASSRQSVSASISPAVTPSSPMDLLAIFGRRNMGSDDAPSITTWLVRGIPSSMTLQGLLEWWPIDGTWDLLYFPLRGDGGRPRGYAFINFVDEARAVEFRERWHGALLAWPQCRVRRIQVHRYRSPGPHSVGPLRR